MRFVHRRAVFTYEVTKKCLQNLVQTSEVALSQQQVNVCINHQK